MSPESDPSSLHGKPVGRRERKKLETRRKIFRSAFELFALKGFEGTTVEEIAQRADVAKGTIFNYFPHKRAFLLAAHREWMVRLEEDLGPPDSWEGTAQDQLLRILEYMADLSAEYREISRMVIFESMRETYLRIARNEGPDSQDGVHLLEGLVVEIIRRGKAQGAVRPEVEEEQAASLVASTAFNTLVRWLVKGGSAADMKVALAAKLNLIFTGLNP